MTAPSIFANTDQLLSASTTYRAGANEYAEVARRLAYAGLPAMPSDIQAEVRTAISESARELFALEAELARDAAALRNTAHLFAESQLGVSGSAPDGFRWLEEAMHLLDGAGLLGSLVAGLSPPEVLAKELTQAWAALRDALPKGGDSVSVGGIERWAGAGVEMAKGAATDYLGRLGDAAHAFDVWAHLSDRALDLGRILRTGSDDAQSLAAGLFRGAGQEVASAEAAFLTAVDGAGGVLVKGGGALRGLPVIGAVASGIFDVVGGKSPAEAVVANAAVFVGGVAVTALLAGSGVGEVVVAAAVVGVAVHWTAEEVWENWKDPGKIAGDIGGVFVTGADDVGGAIVSSAGVARDVVAGGIGAMGSLFKFG